MARLRPTQSPRRDALFVKSMPCPLGQLFEVSCSPCKGAFTGRAPAGWGPSRLPWAEPALDEIGELPPHVQASCARLQDKRSNGVGDSAHQGGLRVIAAPTAT